MSEKKVVKKKKAAGSEGRAGSGRVTTFDQRTITEFKEAFGLMDVDKDGIISAEDVKAIFGMNGVNISDSQASSMVKEAGSALNFTVFLTLFGERLTGTDPENKIVEAFENFDLKQEGFIPEEELLRVLKYKKGQPLDEQEIKNMYTGNPPIAGGKVDYKAFAHVISTGGDDK